MKWKYKLSSIKLYWMLYFHSYTSTKGHTVTWLVQALH